MPARLLTPFVALCLAASVALGVLACKTPGQTALLGAAVGSAIGHHPLRNAALGAGVGYAAGRLAQHERSRHDDHGYARERRYYGRPERPVGQPTERPGFVTSPYPPHNLIDVRGIPHGAQVLDPSVRQVFVNP